MVGPWSVVFWAALAAIILSLTLFWQHATAQENESLRRSRWIEAAGKAFALDDVVRYAPGAPPLTLRPTRLREVLQESLLRIGVDVPTHQGGDPHVAGDSDALGRAFDVLVSGGAQVHLTTEGPVAGLTVVGGSGNADEFGVLVARRIVEMHGGQLHFTADGFRVTLPVV